MRLDKTPLISRISYFYLGVRPQKPLSRTDGTSDTVRFFFILRDRWKNLRDRFGSSKHLEKTLDKDIVWISTVFFNILESTCVCERVCCYCCL